MKTIFMTAFVQMFIFQKTNQSINLILSLNSDLL